MTADFVQLCVEELAVCRNVPVGADSLIHRITKRAGCDKETAKNRVYALISDSQERFETPGQWSERSDPEPDRDVFKRVPGKNRKVFVQLLDPETDGYYGIGPGSGTKPFVPLKLDGYQPSEAVRAAYNARLEEFRKLREQWEAGRKSKIRGGTVRSKKRQENNSSDRGRKGQGKPGSPPGATGCFMLLGPACLRLLQQHTDGSTRASVFVAEGHMDLVVEDLKPPLLASIIERGTLLSYLAALERIWGMVSLTRGVPPRVVLLVPHGEPQEHIAALSQRYPSVEIMQWKTEISTIK